MDIMNMVEFFGIYVWLISIISQNKKLDKFCEVNNTEAPKYYLLLPHHHQNLLFELGLYYIPNHKSKLYCLPDII